MSNVEDASKTPNKGLKKSNSTNSTPVDKSANMSMSSILNKLTPSEKKRQKSFNKTGKVG